MTKTLNVKRRSIKASPRPRRTVHRLSIFTLSSRLPHSVQGSARTVPSRKQSCCTPFSVPHSSVPIPQHLRGFQDFLRCLHSVLIGLEIEFFYKAKAIKKASCRNFCYSTRLRISISFLCPYGRLRSAPARFSDAQRVCHFRDQSGCKGI